MEAIRSQTLCAAMTVAITLLFLSAGTASVHAATLTVCATGCPHTTIQAAHNAATTGDTIRVKPGTYAGLIITKQVTIEGETYDRTNPKNNTVHITSQILIQNGTWGWDQGPVIRGFHIAALDPVRGVRTPYTIEYCFVEAAGQGNDGISFESAGGIIRGNHVDPGGDDNIDVDSQTMNILIEDNVLKNSNQDGIEVRQQPSTIPQRVTLTIRNNRFEQNGQDGLQIMDYNNFTNRRYILERNIFIGAGNKLNGAAIAIMAAEETIENFSAAPMPEPLYATNNIFMNGDGGISGGANLIAINNIFSGNTLFDLKNVNGNSNVMNSLFATTAKLQGTNNLETATTKTGNPLLSAEYIPQSGSLAIDAGRASYQHTYTYTSQAITEPVINLTTSQYTGSAPDIGARESGSLTITGTPSQTPAPTLPPGTITPTTTPPPGCSRKTQGDADCDGLIKLSDFSAWRAEFYGEVTSKTADFNASNTVTITDHAIWRQSFFDSQ